MLNIDQFVYTTSDSGKKGYQIVAKSDGIDENIIKEIDPYIYPLGIDPASFTESKSLLILKNNKIAFSKICNIGIGYDGRDNTIYNHTLIINKMDFYKIDCDTRILENFYFKNYSIKGVLPQLKIQAQKAALPTNCLDELDSILPAILYRLFRKQKIAILSSNPSCLQFILLFVPPSVRFLSFSTLVAEPNKQSKYSLVLTTEQYVKNFDDNFQIMRLSESSNIPKSLLYESILYIKKLIDLKKFAELNNIYKSFEESSNSDFANKIILFTNLSQFKNLPTVEEKAVYAPKILKILENFDNDTFLLYSDEIRNALKPNHSLSNDTYDLTTLYSLAALIYCPIQHIDDFLNSSAQNIDDFLNRITVTLNNYEKK